MNPGSICLVIVLFTLDSVCGRFTQAMHPMKGRTCHDKFVSKSSKTVSLTKFV